MSETPRPRTQRLHGGQGVPALDRMPIDGGGVHSVSTFVTTLVAPPGSPCRITSSRPRLNDRREPPLESLVLRPLPRDAASYPTQRDERVRFEWDGHTLRAQFRVGPGASYYGAGLAAGPLLRDGRSLTFWNTDAWRYGEESPSLYQSHPFVLVLLPGGRPLGILADCAARGTVAIAPDGIEFCFEDEPFELHVFEAQELPALYAALSLRLGRVELPALWTLGYHQCRWSYSSAAEVLELARRFDERKLPLDAVWLDIDHMDAFRVFRWDLERFPEPGRMCDELHGRGLRAVAILDPGLPRDPEDAITRGALAGRHLVLDARDQPVEGRVWPGPCVFPDFTRAETRAWWAEHARRFVESSGLDGLWNDMNEPALFRSARKTLPDTALHRGLGGGSHARFHNLYGQLMAQATRAGLERARPDERPFVLTRANHLAGARFAASWTGDNQATWTDLAWSIPMVLSLGLCGQPISGPDLGGFDGDPDPELFARWFELGAYLPFVRGHSEKSACRKEPWSFGPEIEAAVRAALERRYRLLPYVYTQLEAALARGLPLVRPLFWAAPDDERLRGVDDQFLLGEDLLVAPVVRPGEREREVVLPRNPGGWYAFPEGGRPVLEERVRVPAPLGRTPVFARAGAIVPTCAAGLRAEDARSAKLELHVFLDAAARASGTLYEDDGHSHAHRQGASMRTRFEWAEGALVRRSEGRFEAPARALETRVHGPI